jgi:hypothetical protein
MLLVRTVWPFERFEWTLTSDRIDGALRLEQTDDGFTTAILELEAPWLFGFSRSLPRRALTRLYALCQTAAEL